MMDGLVFLFDVDNTLIDNDGIQQDLGDHIAERFGDGSRKRYWELFEEQRNATGYADYLGALERLRGENLHERHLLSLSNWLLDYEFSKRLYPDALGCVRHAAQWGRPVILSDGDGVFQPRKVERSGLWRAFAGDVLIYVHKENELADIERHFPARRYVLIDDKLRVLTAVKQRWGERVTTVFPRQGHYANDPEALSTYPAADLTIAAISDLLRLDRESFQAPTSMEARE